SSDRPSLSRRRQQAFGPSRPNASATPAALSPAEQQCEKPTKSHPTVHTPHDLPFYSGIARPGSSSSRASPKRHTLFPVTRRKKPLRARCPEGDLAGVEATDGFGLRVNPALGIPAHVSSFAQPRLRNARRLRA